MVATNPLSETSWTTRDIARIGRGWWVLLVTGLVSIVAGGIILSIDWTLSDLAAFIGLLLVARGVLSMFSVPVDGAGRGWSIGLGLLETGVGVAVLAWPGPTLLVLAFWIGWYVLFIGTLTIAGAISGRHVLPYWGWLLVLGIVEVLLAVWLLGRPRLTLVAAVYALGFWSMFYGVAQIMLAFDIKRLHRTTSHAADEVTAMTTGDRDGRSRERSGATPAGGV